MTACSRTGRATHSVRNQGKPADATVAHREAIRLDPDLAMAHFHLGLALSEPGRKRPEAIAEYREAIRLKPDYADAHSCLGTALFDQGKLDEAIVAYREAIRLKPDLATAHYQLGIALSRPGKLAEAIAEYREAIRLKPDQAEAHCNLALLLRHQGRYTESLAEFRLGHEQGSKMPGWRYPSGEWVRQAERLVALESRLPAVLRGDDKPKDAAEMIEFADIASHTKRFGPSAPLR